MSEHKRFKKLILLAEKIKELPSQYKNKKGLKEVDKFIFEWNSSVSGSCLFGLRTELDSSYGIYGSSSIYQLQNFDETEKACLQKAWNKYLEENTENILNYLSAHIMKEGLKSIEKAENCLMEELGQIEAFKNRVID